MSDVPSAKLVLLRDLHNYQPGDSVRITGIWVEHEGDIGIIEYDGIRVQIELEKIEKIPEKGELVQCLGEIKSSHDCISARVLRSVNTLDMDLYEKVVKLINKSDI